MNKKYVIYAKRKFCIDKDDKDYINRKKAKDHCHHSHSKCNLNYSVQK